MLSKILLFIGAWIIVSAPAAFAYQCAFGDVVAGIACAAGLVLAGGLTVWESVNHA